MDISLRDRFALAALPVLMGWYGEDGIEDAAADAYFVADFCLASRGEKEGDK